MEYIEGKGRLPNFVVHSRLVLANYNLQRWINTHSRKLQKPLVVDSCQNVVAVCVFCKHNRRVTIVTNVTLRILVRESV